MKEKTFGIERVVFLVSFIFIGAAFVVTLFAPIDPKSIIPHSREVVLVVHAICSLTCLFLVIKPVFPVSIAVLLVESGITMNITYEQLGIFLFYVCVILMSAKGKLIDKTVLKLSILFGYHAITLGLILTHGLDKFIIALGSSVLFFVVSLWLYSILKAKVACFMPTSVTDNSVIDKQAGSKLSLSNYKLTDRQKNMILDNLHNNLSYKELSDKYYVSLSTVKKDFTEVFQVFGVTKLEELHLLLLRYQVSM